MFKKITIENFRGIKDLTIEDFGKVNLFVGKNNSCKTSVLEALFICTHPKSPFEYLSTNFMRGLVYLDTERRLGERSLPAEFNYESLFYNLDINNKISLEFTAFDGKKVKMISKPLINSVIEDGSLKEIITALETSIIYDEKEPLIVKYPSDQANSQALFSRVYISPFKAVLEKEYDNITKQNNKEKVVNILKQIDPSISSFEALTTRFSILIKKDNIKNLVPLKGFGDGINKIFNIACSIYGNELLEKGILLIDEIENGLHYTAQEKLWNWLFEIAEEKNIQIFATTHSIDTVRAFTKVAKDKEEKDIRLFRLEKYDDEIIETKYNYENLETAVEEMNLDPR